MNIPFYAKNSICITVLPFACKGEWLKAKGELRYCFHLSHFTFHISPFTFQISVFLNIISDAGRPFSNSIFI